MIITLSQRRYAAIEFSCRASMPCKAPSLHRMDLSLAHLARLAKPSLRSVNSALIGLARCDGF